MKLKLASGILFMAASIVYFVFLATTDGVGMHWVVGVALGACGVLDLLAWNIRRKRLNR